MMLSARFLALASLPAAALVLGCSSNKQTGATYTADRPPTAPAPAPATSSARTTTGTPGWSAPVWRGPTSGAQSPSVTATPPPTVTPYTPAAPRPLPSTSTGFGWSGSLREAQDSARAQGKLIFLESGREACGNCQYLKNEVIPSASVSPQLGAMSVGYYDDCDKTPYSEAFNILQANVVGAGTLPLCGWVTPDLRWVHGFWGRREPGRFLAEIESARSAYQRMAEIARPASSLELGRLPSAGSLPDAELADVSAELADDKMIETTPAAALDPAADAPRLATAPAPTPAPAEVAATEPVAAAPSASTQAPIFASMSPSATAATAPVDTRTWVRDELRRAAAALAGRDYAEARAILAGVHAKASGLPESREADKGEVAIYNLRKIEKAGASADADKLRAAAQRDLKDTVWVSLFA